MAQQHNVKALAQQEFSGMNWGNGLSKQQILGAFKDAPTVQRMLQDELPDKTFRSSNEVMNAIPNRMWDLTNQAIDFGSVESNYLKSRAAHFNILGETPGWGDITEQQQQQDQQSRGS